MTKTLCLLCVLWYRPTVRQVINELIRPFSPPHLCWGVHE